MSSKTTFSAQYFRDHMREVLNKALTEVVTITRFGDEFLITSNRALSRNLDIKPSQDAKKPTRPSSNTDLCEHGQLKGKCLWKGCKYGPKA